MKCLLPIVFVLVLIASATVPSKAQEANAEDKKAANVPAPEVAKLSKEDIAKFEPMLGEYLDAKNSGESKLKLSALVKALEDYSEEKKVSSPVADVKAWADMFGRYNQASFAKRKVYATGRIKTELFRLFRNGEHYAYEYSFYVPKDYDPNKSWPVLLCLHDKGAKNLGVGYIRKLWQNKEYKALCEKFIIIAPHLPAKLPKRKMKIKVGKKSRRIMTSSKRLKWFNNYHLLSILMPLYEIRKSYNCDPTRIFIEGVGEGADAAVTLAAVSSGKFAGVISRHGKLREPRLMTGLQHTPSLFLMREGGPFSKGSGKEFIDLVKAASNGETKYDSLQVEVVPKLGGKKLPLRMYAYQATDPLMDANPKVAEFIGKHVLNPYPKTVRITTNTSVFKSHGLIKITADDIAAGEIVDCVAKFDREKNTVELTGSHFFKVTLFLNDLVLDLSKPVQVLVNGKIVDARVPVRDPAFMFRTFNRSKTDFHLTMTALIRVPEFNWKEEKKPDDAKKGEEEGKKKDGEAKDGTSKSVRDDTGTKGNSKQKTK